MKKTNNSQRLAIALWGDHSGLRQEPKIKFEQNSSLYLNVDSDAQGTIRLVSCARSKFKKAMSNATLLFTAVALGERAILSTVRCRFFCLRNFRFGSASAVELDEGSG